MKKLFLTLVLALVLAMPGMAQAALITSWTLDLSSYTSSSDDIFSDIQYLEVAGNGVISQDLGTSSNPSNIVVGSTFTATSLLYTVGYYSGGVWTPFSTTAGYLTIESSDLAGYVDSVDTVNGTFTYAYTSGTVELKLGGTTIATLTLTDGEGNSTSEEGGSFLEGHSYITVEVLNSLLGSLISYGASGNTYDTASAWLVFDLNNGLNSQLTDYSVIDDGDGTYTLKATVATGGPVTLYATPEPSTFLILGFGLLGLVGFRKKFKKA